VTRVRALKLKDVPAGSTLDVQVKLATVTPTTATLQILTAADQQIGQLQLDMASGTITGSMPNPGQADVHVTNTTFAINDVTQWTDGQYVVVRSITPDGRHVSGRDDGGGPQYSTADLVKVGHFDEPAVTP
jgi:hypothetical protein